MRDPNQVCHIAVPCADLDETSDFYVNKLGCELARRYDDRVTFNFFGDQLVCHLSPESVDPQPKMYPRHFGITFVDKAKFDELLNRAHEKNIPFFRKLFTRFSGQQEEHHTFFLQDPANNLLEFKYYYDSEMRY